MIIIFGGSIILSPQIEKTCSVTNLGFNYFSPSILAFGTDWRAATLEIGGSDSLTGTRLFAMYVFVCTTKIRHGLSITEETLPFSDSRK